MGALWIFHPQLAADIYNVLPKTDSKANRIGPTIKSRVVRVGVIGFHAPQHSYLMLPRRHALLPVKGI